MENGIDSFNEFFFVMVTKPPNTHWKPIFYNIHIDNKSRYTRIVVCGNTSLKPLQDSKFIKKTCVGV